MKSILYQVSAWLILCLFASFSFGQTVHPDYHDGRIYLKINDQSTLKLKDIESIYKDPRLSAWAPVLNQHQVTTIQKAFPLLRTPVFDRTYELHFKDLDHADELVRKLASLPDVEYAEKVALYRTVYTPNDPNQSSQWYLTTINATSAWDLHQGGSSVVAIVDDAVRITHQDLSPNTWVNPGETPGDGIDNDGNGYIDDINGWDAADNDNNPNPPSSASNSSFTHGTHCAGIAAAATDNSTGIASIGFNTKIMAVKCTYDTASNTSIIYTGFQGIQYAMAAGADVISMSWGGPGFNNTAQNIINQANSMGIVLVAASGNDNSSSTFYPAGYANVISVAATAQSDAKASFSNYGTWLDISAPGVGIFSTLAGSNSSYGNQSGTSMACPLVAGLCGLMKSYSPSATPATIESCLTSSADDIDAQNPSYIGQLGAGRINAQAALQCMNPNTPPIANFTQDATTGCVGANIQFTDLSSGNPTSWSWSITGATPPTSTQQNPTFTFSAAGTYTVNLTATNPFGNDTETKTGLITITSSGLALPFIEDFESGSFATNGWNIDNTDGSYTWEIAAVTGTSPGGTSAKMDFYNYNSPGQRDGLTTPPLDLSTVVAAQLSFEHAYRRYNTSSTDSLLIYLSTDCGATFPNKIFAGGEDGAGSFATATTSTSPFTPTQTSDWCLGTVGANCFTIDLTPYVGNSSVVIRFEGYTNFQNNLFLDNINISGTTGNQAPVADFSANTTLGCAPLAVSFTDQSTFSPTSWSWSFPSGTPATSAVQNPTVTYSTPGTYAVTLTATNAFGADTKTQSGFITVNTCSPVSCDTLSNFNNGTPALYTGSGFTGFASGHNSFGDLAKAEYFANTNNQPYLTGVLYNFAVAIPANANSTLTFSIWDDAGTGGTPGTVIGTEDIPIADIAADIQAGNATFVNFGGSVPLTGAFYAGIELDYGTGGAIEDTVALITNTTPETSPATAWELWDNGTWNDYGTSWTLDVAHAIFAFVSDTLPTASYTASVTSGCTGTAITFSNTSTNASNFQWVFPGGTPYSSTDANPTVTYDTVGVHDVILIAYGSCAGVDIKIDTSQITISDGPSLSVGNVSDATCGQSNGSATVTATGGTGGYTYSWNTSPVQTGATATGLSFGNYIVTVTDASGCISTTTVSIGDVAGPVATVSSWVNETCGLANGSATASATGGVGGYSYLWSNSQTTITATGLSANTYQVFVTDANGCVDSAAVTLTGSPAVSVSVAGTDANCGTNGTATANVTGGTAPFNYTWNTSPPQTTASLSGLGAGTYTVIVDDANGCSDTASVTVNVPVNVFTITAGGITPENCADGDGTATVVATGGSPSYTYLWDTSPPQTTATATGLSAGTYQVTVSDMAGCSSSLSFTIGSTGTPIVIDFGPDTTSCDPVIICAGITTGFQVLWSTGETTDCITAAPGNTIWLQMTEMSSGCMASDTITIAQGIPPIVDLGSDTMDCNSVLLNAGNPGSLYLWSDGSTMNTLNVTQSGTYAVEVTNDIGCVSTDSVDVTIIDSPMADFNFTFGGNGWDYAFTNGSTGGGTTTYLWDFGDGVGTSTDENPNYTYSVAGNVTVTLVVTNECGSDTISQSLSVTSIDQIPFESIRFFPNPSTGLLVIELHDSKEQEVELKMYNMLGQEVFHKSWKLTAGKLNETLQFDELAEGTYTLVLRGKEKSVVRRWVIER